jgi:cytochrome c biogenesis protein CcdA/thiol-disulfide isomerase/thioredoxin
VLPALLSAGAVGGRRRPVGIAVGLATTFTITIAGVAEVVDGVGLGDGFLRTLAVAALLLFGLAVALPAVGERLEAPLSRLSRLGPRSAGDGFVSGLGVGAALGFVYAPCAGPILAAVIAVSAASGRTVAVGVAYAAGSAVVLLALALGGRTLADRIRRTGRGPALQRVLGAVMVLTAVAMLARLDIRFQTALANHLSGGGVLGFLANPTGSLERSHTVRTRLDDLRGKARFATQTASTEGTAALPRLGQAPEFTDTQRWFNTPGGRPLTMRGLRGRVVLVDFWTYTCINCIRTQPYLKAWDRRYREAGLTIVGVHTPEFAFEKLAGNVRSAVSAAGLRYPVVQDNDYGTWNAWGNQFWPAEYLVDARGQVRRAHFGEGEYRETEAAIRALLAERGDTSLPARAHPRGALHPTGEATPETYLGARRAERFLPRTPAVGIHDFTAYRRDLPVSHFSYRGRWRIGSEAATAMLGASLRGVVAGKNVYLVLSSAGGVPRRVAVLLDGRPLGAGAGADVSAGALVVRGQRLYHLVSLPRAGVHRIELRFAPGVSAFAFTFG